MNRHHRRRAARLNRDRPKFRLVRTMEVDDAAQALGNCTCPALVTTGGGLVAIEHHHVHGCPNLYRLLKEAR
jgi:hypothetical protein